MSLIFAAIDDKPVVGIAIVVVAMVRIRLFSWAMQPGAMVSMKGSATEDTNNCFRLIQWRAIISVSKGELDYIEFVSITIRNEDEYLARLTPTMRRMTSLGVRMGYSPIMIAMFNLKIAVDQLHEMIEQGIKLWAQSVLLDSRT